MKNENANVSLEKLIEDSVPELEKGFSVLTLKEKRSLTRFSFELFEVKSTSTSFHESRMTLLGVVMRNLDLKQLFELGIHEFDLPRHLIHAVNVSTLEIRMYLEARLMIIEKGEKKEHDQHLCDIKILTASFEIIDCLITGLSNDDILEYLETSDKVSGTCALELINSLREVASQCAEFILDVECEIKRECEIGENIEKEKLGFTNNSNDFGKDIIIRGLYWIVYYCTLISSKWKIIEPDEDLHKYIRLLEVVSQYLNPLHFAASFPTLVHISVLDWGNTPGILESIIKSMLSFCSLIVECENKSVHESSEFSNIKTSCKINGLYSGLYHASLLVTSAWWSPGVDTYRYVKKTNKGCNVHVDVDYIYRNYIELNNCKVESQEFNFQANGNNKVIRYSLGIKPLDTNTIPEYTLLDDNINTGVTRIRKIATTVFNSIRNISMEGACLVNIHTLEDLDFLSKTLENPDSVSFEKVSGIIQTLVCVFTLLTCRIPNSDVPERIWRLLFLIIIKLTPKSTKGYYFDSGRKITILISLMRSIAVSLSTGYSECSELFDKLLEELKMETSYRIPMLIIKQYCEEFSEEDEDTVRFFRDLLSL